MAVGGLTAKEAAKGRRKRKLGRESIAGLAFRRGSKNAISFFVSVKF